MRVWLGSNYVGQMSGSELPTRLPVDWIVEAHGSLIPVDSRFYPIYFDHTQADGGSMMIWVIFCSGSWGPGIHVDVRMKCTTYLNTAVDQVWQPASPNVSGLFQQYSAPWCTAKIVQESFEHDDSVLALEFPRPHSDSVCGMCRANKSDALVDLLLMP